MTKARDIVDQFNNNGFHHLQTISVASGSAGADVLYFLSVFSADFTLYFLKFMCNSTSYSLTSATWGFQFGNGGSVVANGEAVKTAVTFTNANSQSDGGVVYHCTNGVIALGNFSGSAPNTFQGSMYVANPFSSTIDTAYWGEAICTQDDADNIIFRETFAGRQEIADTFSATDIAIRIFANASAYNQSGTTINLASDKKNISGTVAIYGVKGFS